MATMKTRNNAKNLDWAIKDSLKQLQDEVEKLRAANERTEEQLQSLMNRLDDTEVGFVLSCVHVVFHNGVSRFPQQNWRDSKRMYRKVSNRYTLESVVTRIRLTIRGWNGKRNLVRLPRFTVLHMS